MPINTQEKPKPKLGPRAYSAVCAVGSQDNSISVWWTAKARSAAVAQHIFNYSVLDICWSSDGLSLFACSYDGTVAALCFDQGEFGTPIDPEEKVYGSLLSDFHIL
jgi:protein HIRA/HIR1